MGIVSVGFNVGGILEVKFVGFCDFLERGWKRSEVKVIFEVFSFVDFEGSDVFNEVKNIGNKRGSMGVGV